MRILAVSLVALAACQSADSGKDKKETYAPEGVAPEIKSADSGPDSKKPVWQYKDLEDHAGQQITLEGIFKVYPKHRGKHAMVVLDGGLNVYIPHAELFWKGEDWTRHDNKRCRLVGTLYTYTPPIDDMPGPFLDNPSNLELLSAETPPAK